MSGEVYYREKCVCGAEIELGEEFNFIGVERLAAKFERWQSQHANCLRLFHEVQVIRAEKLLQARSQKRLNAG